MLKDKLKLEIISPIEKLKKVIKRSKELVSENTEITEVEARKIAAQELKNNE